MALTGVSLPADNTRRGVVPARSTIQIVRPGWPPVFHRKATARDVGDQMGAAGAVPVRAEAAVVILSTERYGRSVCAGASEGQTTAKPAATAARC